MLVQDLKAFLSGRWKIERLLLDRRNSARGRFVGQAQLTPAAGCLLYEERGTLSLRAHKGYAEQRYRYDFISPNCASVKFRDGRPFHDLDLSRGRATVRHTCDPDLYEGRFTAIDSSRWCSTWKVLGPRKDQEIATLFTRVP